MKYSSSKQAYFLCQWIVVERPLKIGREQINKFRELKDQSGRPLGERLHYFTAHKSWSCLVQQPGNNLSQFFPSTNLRCEIKYKYSLSEFLQVKWKSIANTLLWLDSWFQWTTSVQCMSGSQSLAQAIFPGQPPVSFFSSFTYCWCDQHPIKLNIYLWKKIPKRHNSKRLV